MDNDDEQNVNVNVNENNQNIKDQDEDNNNKDDKYLEYRKPEKKPEKKPVKRLTHKQQMKIHKKNLKKLPKFLKNKNVKKDLINQMNAFDNMFRGNKFTANQLQTYSKSVRKLRKKKKSKKLKKIAMTNQIQYMNALFNADRQLNSLSSFNLMKTTPQNYLNLFNDNNLSKLWTNTSIPFTSNKSSMVKNFNKSFHSFLLHGLINDFKKSDKKKKIKQIL